MYKYLPIIAIFLLGSCASKKMVIDKTDAKIAIARVMNEQEVAWSAGDIDAFMQGYWKSERLTFIGRKGLSYGWITTLENYKKGYPTKEDMGTLQFDIHSLEQLAPDAYHMIGKYTLIKEGKNNQSGFFTLIWKHIDGKWKIVSDHTS